MTSVPVGMGVGLSIYTQPAAAVPAVLGATAGTLSPPLTIPGVVPSTVPDDLFQTPSVFHAQAALVSTAPAIDRSCPSELVDRLEYVLKKRVTDADSYPPQLRTAIQGFMERAGALLSEMAVPEDAEGTIYFVLLEDVAPNAFVYKLANGAKVIGITLGLIDTLESDDELAFILGHELEHAHSELQKKADRVRDGEAMFLNRSAESEVDIRSVRRMMDRGRNPHAAVRWLRRMEEKYDDLPGLTHPMYRTRSNAIDAAIAANVRLKGEGAEHRLDHAPSTHSVLGDAREVLFREGHLEKFLIGKVEALLETHGIVNRWYKGVRDNYKIDFPHEGARRRHSGDRQTFFENVFLRRWSDILMLLPPSFDAARKVEWQLRLAANLHQEFERARKTFLGDEFLPADAEQFEAMVALEKRRYPINVPNLVSCLRMRESLADEMTKNPGQDFTKDLRKVDEELRAAMALFEEGDALDRFVAAGYRDARREDVDIQSLTDHFNLDQFSATGLKIRGIHDLVFNAVDREQRMRDRGQLRALMLASTLEGFHESIGKINLFALGADARRGILEKAGALLGAADVRSAPAIQVRDYIFSLLKDCFAKECPPEARVFAVRELRKVIDAAYGAEVVPSAAKLLKFALPVVGEEGEELVRAFQSKAIGAMLDSLSERDDLKSSLIKLEKCNEMFSLVDNSEISFGSYRSPVSPVRQIAHKLTRAASALGLNARQLDALIYVHIPSLMPDSMGPVELDQIRAQLISIVADERLKSFFERQFEFYTVMQIFGESRASRGSEERALRAEFNQLAERMRRFKDTQTGEAEEKGHIDSEIRRIDARIAEIDSEKRAKNYDLLVAAPGVWRLKGEETNEIHLGGYYEEKDELADFLLSKLSLERPWDMESASLLIRSATTNCRAAVGNFLSRCFEWHLAQTGSMEEAAYRFWRAADDARIAPRSYNLFGIEGPFITSLYTVERDSPDGTRVVVDLDKFEAYLKGVVRFVHDFSSESRPRARYLREERGRLIPEHRAGESDFEIDLRVNWSAVVFPNLWSDPSNYRNLSPETVANVFLAYVKGCGHFYADKSSNAVVNFLWAKRDADPAVARVLKDPHMVRALRHQSGKVKLAKWQLEKISGFADFLVDYKAGRAALPGKTEIRDVVRVCHEYLRKQFPEPTPASHEILEYVEGQLLPSEAETGLLSELRLNENNWTESGALYGIDAPDYLAGGLDNAGERIEVIRYLTGISNTPPKLKRYSSNDVEWVGKYFMANGELFRTVAMQAIIGEEAKKMHSSPVYAAVRDLIMDGAANDEALVAVFDTYMEVLPHGERKLLMANALAVFDSSRKGRPSFRRLLEAAGPLGAKAAQGLVTSGVATGELRRDLMTSFDSVLPPTRARIYEQLAEVFGENYADISAVGRILGSGSLNYVVEVWLKGENGPRRAAVRIQKDHVQGMVQNEYVAWQHATQRLIRHENPHVRRYGRFIRGLIGAAYQSLRPDGIELDLERERDRYELAKGAYGREERHPESRLNVDVATPVFDLQGKILPEYQKTVSVYEYVESTRWDDIRSPDERRAIAAQVVETELGALQNGAFDPDAHRGNWLIDHNSGRVVRVDYAQMAELNGGQIARFKELFRLLLNPIGGAMLQAYLVEHFTEIFNMESSPAGLQEGLSAVFALPEIPSEPMERLLFIKNQLELWYADRGEIADFAFREGIMAPMGLFLRLNLYREYLGDFEYYARIGSFLMQ